MRIASVHRKNPLHELKSQIPIDDDDDDEHDLNGATDVDVVPAAPSKFGGVPIGSPRSCPICGTSFSVCMRPLRARTNTYLVPLARKACKKM